MPQQDSQRDDDINDVPGDTVTAEPSTYTATEEDEEELEILTGDDPLADGDDADEGDPKLGHALS